MDCESCLKKCKAECCGVIPLPKEIIMKYKFIRIPIHHEDFGDIILATDKDNYCCYLGEDLRCSIYENRPDICRKFGDESHILMTCKWQNANGAIRNRAERRRIEREQNKEQNSVINQINKNNEK